MNMSIWVYVIIAFIVFDLIVAVLIVVKRTRGRKLGLPEMQYIKSHWIRIIDSAGSNPVQAIMDADKLLDYALGKHGFNGSLGEKLKVAGPRFGDLNGVWAAHKIRNQVAHEMGGIDKSEAQRALVRFKRALNDLGAGL